ncbi:putative anti-sigma factor kinase [Frankia canadensis]|uniref:Putative anti-sigma factor kinase n=1 Tax=Frankia canadensis TaxID=1836972 RepID=A0A2I2L2Z5_9ACTN|nr:sensor histidine kinase [Frankia canadensis]SNQ52281.1 putative anti-sigma factor kinase [Frankia canadensis]SOU59571.1 putative anti-sigma factor kinase [Frankia canadensis]
MATGSALASAGADGIRHEAFLYRGDVGFLSATRDFVLAGLAADEDVLVVLPPQRTAQLRATLGRAVKRVEFLDLDEIGRNPARLLPAWREFVERGLTSGRSMRGVGEPVRPERSAPELRECLLHEALLNEAFVGPPSWRLRCVYEAPALDPDTAEGVWRTHPVVVDGGFARASTRWRGEQAWADPFAERLPDLGPPAAELAFGPADLGLVRAAVTHAARGEGLDSDRVDDLELAVHEVATNSVRHGGGRGTVRFWSAAGDLVCEVTDAGLVTDRLAGRRRPDLELGGGRGLWLANQLCDLVQLRSSAAGTVVRMHMAGGRG